MIRSPKRYFRRIELLSALSIFLLPFFFGKNLVVSGITLYQRFISPYKGWRCAYNVRFGGESCSAYGKRVISESGVFFGGLLLEQRFRACRYFHYAYIPIFAQINERNDPGFLDCCGCLCFNSPGGPEFMSMRERQIREGRERELRETIFLSRVNPELLGNASVKKELKLNDQQAEKSEELIRNTRAEMREKLGLFDLSREERRTKMREVNREITPRPSRQSVHSSSPSKSLGTCKSPTSKAASKRSGIQRSCRS